MKCRWKYCHYLGNIRNIHSLYICKQLFKYENRFQNFPDDRDIWKEIETVTTCLRMEQCDSEAEFLCQMFQHIPQELQHRLLVMTADHSEDTMEHCKLLLLLLRRFPQTIATHGVSTFI